jgi:GNAT superfamily N-acetyltransferase
VATLPVAGGTTPKDVRTLEEHMAATWPPLEQAWLGRWLLRAGGGWTGRANSALPVGDPGCAVGAALDAVIAWYADRGLPPMIAVPAPGQEALGREVAEQGWTPSHGAIVMTAPTAQVLGRLPERDDLPPVQVAAEPDASWLASYHYRGGALPAHAVAILRGGGARFASVRAGRDVLAIGRFVVADGRVGITAMEVAAEHRRAGVGSHVLRGMVAAAGAHAASAWLQVDPENAGGRALYARAGFGAHHTYRYHVGPERTPS